MSNLIFGIGGQDGSLLAEYLLGLGFEVVGVGRRDISEYEKYVQDLRCNNFTYEICDITDPSSIASLLRKYEPQYVYNLAGQSNVVASFNNPLSTFRVNVDPCVSILEWIRTNDPYVRFFQASSAEMYGDYAGIRNENAEFKPLSPYGISKLASHRLIDLYRSRYDLFCVSGILFNHTSVRRQAHYVEKKIARYVAGLTADRRNFYKLMLGNLDATRDFGYAPDFVRGFVASLKAEESADYVFATGRLTSIQQLCEIAFSHIGEDWRDFVETDEKLVRKVDFLDVVGDSSFAQNNIRWCNTKAIEDIMAEMIEYEKKIQTKN